MRAIGARSVTAIALLGGVTLLQWQMGLWRADYWAQLDPWVTFLAAAFAMGCAALVSGYWRLGEPSEYYFRVGERLPWGGAEVAMLGSRKRALLVGHDTQARVVELPPSIMRTLYVLVFLGVGLVAIDNRAVALLRDTPKRFAGPGFEWCPEPKPPPKEEKLQQGCKLVIRAYQLGYAKDLGSCGAKQEEDKKVEVCRKRQRDEPYLHYAYRLFDKHADSLLTQDDGPGVFERLSYQLEHLEALVDATLDSVAMQPRSAHHLFVNLPDPRPSFTDRAKFRLSRGCGARLANLEHFPRMQDGPLGPSKLLEHVMDQLLFNAAYRPVIGQCTELYVHWDSPKDACAKLVAHPEDFLADEDALAATNGVLQWRARIAELAHLHMRKAVEPPPASRVVSFQCLIFDDEAPLADKTIKLDGDELHVREVHTKPLVADGASQIRLYKRLAELFAEGFSYGRLTSNQSIGASAEEATMVAAFKAPGYMLTKLDFLRDADLFLGNEWLTNRPDLLEAYPYHLHLENFIEIFRRQYKIHRGRL